MPKIVVLQPAGLTEAQLNELRELGEVTYHGDMVRDGAEWLERVKGADIIYSNRPGLNESWRELHDVFLTMPFVGTDFLDPAVLKQNNVVASRSPGCNQVAVSEWIVGMMLNYARQLSQLTKATQFDQPAPFYTTSLFGKTVCVVGKGHIGSRTGSILEAFGVQVQYHQRGDDLTSKIKDADFIVDCLSLNPSTINFYNEQFFAQAKHGVVFVTVTSNKMMDLRLVLRHLQSGKIKHLITDNAHTVLFDTQDVDYQTLLSNPNVTITPHVSAYSDNTQETAARMCLENIKAYLAGKPINVVG
ncbi:MAG TPA: NAD(P)-dependent oxidoreductase [Candidatus Saccharimonadales bacterium]|nr:NAD(P)-dependent oxidoreductase [Candidatus Saccharimonadales bacterium]